MILGTMVRNIRVAGVLGKGGMGEVYLGVDEKLNRKVALKTIHRERALDPELKARFLVEAQVLSQLKHPNICQIHDYIEGEDCDFLVLELIEGSSLKQAIKEGLGESEKMRIALQVADVLSAAHGRSIIHRDLKPANIMLTPQGEVKVLDFGLARNIDDDPALPRGEIATEKGSAGGKRHLMDDEPTASFRTKPGTIPGTPRYISPEQATGEPATPASDMYAFGLLLQELFTGQSAYPAGLRLHALLLRVMEGQTEPIEDLDPELTSIIQRLLSLAPGSRPSAPDTVDRLRSLQLRPLRRRKRLFLGAAVILLAMFAGVMTFQAYRIGVEARRASREAETAKEVSDFLVEMFEINDPFMTFDPLAAKGESLTARMILDRGAARLRTELNEEPLIRARLLDTVGKVYRSLGLYKQARPLIEDALEQRRALLGEEHLAIAESLDNLGLLLRVEGAYDQAEELLRESMAIKRHLLGPDHLGVAENLDALADLLQQRGDPKRPELLLREALEIRRRQLGQNHPVVANTLHTLAILDTDRGDYHAAERTLREVLSIRRQTYGKSHPIVAATLDDLAAAVRGKGNYDEAEACYLEELAIYRKVLGDEHPRIALAIQNLATLLQQKGNNARAEPLLREALAINRRMFGDDHPRVAATLNNLAMLLYARGEYATGERLCHEALAILHRVHGGPSAQHPEIANTLGNLAVLMHASKKYTQAESLYREALTMKQHVLGEQHYQVAISLNNLARLQIARKQYREAEETIRQALNVFRVALPENHWRIANSESVLGACLTGLGQYGQAEELLLSSYPVVRLKTGEHSPYCLQLVQRIVALYHAWGKSDKALEYEAMLARQIDGGQ